MLVSPINFKNFSPIYSHKKNCTSNNHKPQCDTVSFTSSAKKVKEEQSPNVQQGILAGKKMLKSRGNSLTHETLGDILNEISPVPLVVDDIKNDAYVPSKATIAHVLPMYDCNLNLVTANIYLGSIPITSKEEADFIANAAHEYTHVLQRAQDSTYYGILKYTNDSQEAIKIANTSSSLLYKMCDRCKLKLYTNEKEAKNILNLIMTNKINLEKALQGIKFDDMIDTAAVSLAIALDKDENDMKNAIMGWLIQETQNEKEAYSVTIGVLDKTKHDPHTKASRILTREFYSYINKTLQNK